MSQQPNMEEILCDYLDGTLDAKRRKAVDTLLQHDAKLRKALKAMQQVRGVLRDLPVETMPADAANALQRELRPAPQPSIPLYSPQWLIRLAAAFAIAVTAGLVIWSMLPAPMDRRTVAMDAAAPMAVPTEVVAMKMKKDSAVVGIADTDAMEPTLAMKGGRGDGGAAEKQAVEPSSANEPTLMVVVADDISGTEREIRNLLTLNNISYDPESPRPVMRDELAKETQAQVAGKLASAAPPVVASPSPAAARPAMAKAEAEANVLTAQTPAAPTGSAGGGGAGQRSAGEAPQAMPSAQQAGSPAQRRSQAIAARAPSESYGMVVARNVTPDQLGKIRSGLRDASRSGNLRVVDAPADQINQATVDNRKQAQHRTDVLDPYQQQALIQSLTQLRTGGLDQSVQEQASETQAQRKISYSARYDVTIVVQNETATNAAATRANIPTWPAATKPGSTQASTLPSSK